MELKIVEELIKPYLIENGLIMTELVFTKEYGRTILRLCVDKKGGIDLDTLATVNEYLSNKLDEIDQDMPEYFVEVSSPGAERQLHSLEDALENVGQYINIQTSNMVYEGFLEEVNDDILSIKINVKGRIKRVSVKYADIIKIRLAVKI